MMKMKKFLTVFILMALCGSALADEKSNQDVKIGFLSYLGTTEAAFQDDFDNFRKTITEEYLKTHGDIRPFITSLSARRRRIHFYNSLMTMLMGLRSGKVDEVILPEFTGRYILQMNSNYEIKFVSRMLVSRLSFAFTEDRTHLKEEFDEVIAAMKDDGTLTSLEDEYVTSVLAGKSPKSVKPKVFKGAETITVAVTGDIPPIDMFAGDGNPAGYSTAVLAEIGERLGKNIRFLSIDSGARSQSLSSERADVVFWYRTTETPIDNNDETASAYEKLFRDKPEHVILSLPYFEWDHDYVIKAKETTGLFDMFRR
ncbi:MAG: transporter substrate-binding domain-containing protein [Synergistaceae bacterium]|nr:transporter substrate-binding domain-containing protein [Synergistaceae bacterium]